MQKQILLMSVLLLMVVSFASGHLIDEKLENFQYNAELVSVAPIVDGYLDDPVWEDVLPAKLKQEIITGQEWHDSYDFTGSFKAVWRSGFLYIAIKIQDDQFEKHQSKLFREDQLILHVDEYHYQGKDDMLRYEIPVGVEESALKSSLTSVAWANDGQTCELRFRLGDVASKGNTIGFGIAYDDIDNGQLQNRIAWAPYDYMQENQNLPDLVFTARINPNAQQKLIRWGQIKRLY
ncbi:MAG: hypothetical protein OXD54_18170 [Candidatus Poribacteria bacterium]|nr:hypothetical protein [Candidatus Poribacteria bacterium]